MATLPAQEVGEFFSPWFRASRWDSSLRHVLDFAVHLIVGGNPFAASQSLKPLRRASNPSARIQGL
jgi:hypothetical protein